MDCGFRLHTEIGPGLLESVHEVLLAEALQEWACHSSGEFQHPSVTKVFQAKAAAFLSN